MLEVLFDDHRRYSIGVFSADAVALALDFPLLSEPFESVIHPLVRYGLDNPIDGPTLRPRGFQLGFKEIV